MHYRELYPIANHYGKVIEIKGKSYINFASNDYLGLARSDQVKQAFIKGVEIYGYGSGGSPLVSGYSKHHQILEENFANFLGRESAILFNSGYHANIGIISLL